MFSWKNSQNIPVILRSQFPPPNDEILVKPDETISRNITVPADIPFSIETLDGRTKETLKIDGKTSFNATVIGTEIVREVLPGK